MVIEEQLDFEKPLVYITRAMDIIRKKGYKISLDARGKLLDFLNRGVIEIIDKLIDIGIPKKTKGRDVGKTKKKVITTNILDRFLSKSIFE